MCGSIRKLKLVLQGINLLVSALGLIIIGLSAGLLIKPDYVFDVVLESNDQESMDDESTKMARQKVRTLV